jgi:hypothetical protein
VDLKHPLIKTSKLNKMENNIYDKNENFKRNSSVDKLSQYREIDDFDSKPTLILNHLASSKDDIKTLMTVYPIGSREHDLLWETLLKLNHCISFLKFKLSGGND